MTVGVVIGRSPRTSELGSASSIGSGAGRLFRRIKETLGICSRAAEAAHHYEALRPLSDAALAQRGLTRAELPRSAFEKLTGER
jgi:hypothetical protein